MNSMKRIHMHIMKFLGQWRETGVKTYSRNNVSQHFTLMINILYNQETKKSPNVKNSRTQTSPKWMM